MGLCSVVRCFWNPRCTTRRRDDSAIRSIRNGEQETLESLLNEDPTLVTATEERCTPLYITATYGYSGRVQRDVVPDLRWRVSYREANGSFSWTT